MHLQLLRTLYNHAANGLPVLGVPAEEAQRLRQKMDSDRAADHLVHRAMLFSSATGFVCGLPGYITMPVTIPSNVAGVILIQFYMCATIAALAGRDPHDATVRERAIQCVLNDNTADQEAPAPSDDKTTSSAGREGEAPENEVTGLIGRITTKLGERGMRFIGEQATQWAYRAARQANHGSRSLPLFGGAIGAVTDGMETQSVGKRARRTFLDQRPAARD
jgi:hypothetical protein